ncbi:MAG: TVP38/TMEM64 family protein [Clostridiales bacterium]|nr:TVP38/TMEM64 family protein [Clostridiales bacterium]
MTNKPSQSEKHTNDKLTAIAKLALFLVLVIGIPAYIYFFHYEFIAGFKSFEDIEVFLEKYEVASSFVYIGLQILHVVVSVIPAQPFHLASGYVFGFWIAYLLSMAGIAIGTTATFFLARFLGQDAMHLLFGEKKFVKRIEQMNSKRSLLVLFVLFLIPGLPKDPLGYAVGLSKVKFWHFLLVALVGRTPGIMGTILLGSMIDSGSVKGIVIVSVLSAAFCILGLVYRKRITSWIDSHHLIKK